MRRWSGGMMRCVREAFEEALHVLVNHRVSGQQRIERRELGFVRQFSVDQKIGGFDEIRFFGELLDGNTAVTQNAFFTV